MAVKTEQPAIALSLTLVALLSGALYGVLVGAGVSTAITLPLIAVFAIVATFSILCLSRLNRLAEQKKRLRPDEGKVILLNNAEQHALLLREPPRRKPIVYDDEERKGESEDLSGYEPPTLEQERLIDTSHAGDVAAAGLDCRYETEATTLLSDSLITPTDDDDAQLAETLISDSLIADVKAAEELQRSVSSEEPRNGNGNGSTGPRKAIAPIISIPDILEEIAEHGRNVHMLLLYALKRLAPIEAVLDDMDDSALNRSADVSLNVFEARRIISALDSRLETLRSLTRNHSSPDLLKARTLIQRPLSLATDPMHALLANPARDNLLPENWKSELDTLLAECEEKLGHTISKKIQNF